MRSMRKTAATRRYYPGLVTALLFTASVNVLVFPAWIACLPLESAPLFAIYYGIQPLIIVAFYVEHRRWLAKARRVDPQFAR